MYYAMIITDGIATRVGGMHQQAGRALRAAMRHRTGYVEKYGLGVVWTPKIGWLPGEQPPLGRR